MRSREATLQSPVWRGREHEIRPFGDPKASDSANLDSTAEVRNHSITLLSLKLYYKACIPLREACMHFSFSFHFTWNSAAVIVK
jgi:hypothetical protein